MFILLAVACRDPSPADAGGPAPVSFQRQIAPLLEQSCAAERGCHGDEPTHSVSLDLREAAAAHSLVDRPAKTRPGAVLIAPFDVPNSFVLDKLDGRLGPKEGKRMPLDPETGAPVTVPSVRAAELRLLLEEWIRAGAR